MYMHKSSCGQFWGDLVRNSWRIRLGGSCVRGKLIHFSLPAPFFSKRIYLKIIAQSVNIQL